MSLTERGSATVEAVLLAPVMMVLVMLVVHVHGQADAAARIARAADAGARMASISSPRSMLANGERAARTQVTDLTGLCARTSVQARDVSVSGFRAVSVTVTCTTNSRGLGLLRVRPRTITRSSTEIIDVYRGS